VLWALTSYALSLFLALGLAALFYARSTRAILLTCSACANSIALVVGSLAATKRIRVEAAAVPRRTNVLATSTLAVLQAMAGGPVLVLFAFDSSVRFPSPLFAVTPALVAEGISAWNLASIAGQSPRTTAFVATAFGFLLSAEFLVLVA
jgi:hypothetical protein